MKRVLVLLLLALAGLPPPHACGADVVVRAPASYRVWMLDSDGAVTAAYAVVDNQPEHVVSTTYATGIKNDVSYNVGPETVTYPGGYTEEYTYYQASGNQYEVAFAQYVRVPATGVAAGKGSGS